MAVDAIHDILDVRYPWAATTKSNQEIIAAVAGKRIVIDRIFCTVDTDSLISFGSESVAKGPAWYALADNNIDWVFSALSMAAAENFELTVIVSSTGVLYVQYHFEGATPLVGSGV
jgi:hypothetical protein